MAFTNEETLDAWINGRIGYGKLDAPYWFIGREEHTSDPVLELAARLARPLFDDLFDAHQAIPGGDKWFTGTRPLQPTWHKLMIALLTAQGLEAGEDELRQYQAERLGRAAGETLLLTFYPLPAQGQQGIWPYQASRARPWLGSRKEYEKEVEFTRRVKLHGLIRQHRPRWVLCYGTGLWKAFKTLVQAPDIKWEPTLGGWAERAVANKGATLVTLAPDPTAMGKGKPEQWRALGESVRDWLAKPA